MFMTAAVGVVALLSGGHSSLTPPYASAQFVPRQVIEGPYWNLESGFDSSLMLSNTSDEPIRIYPDLFAASGQTVELPMIALRERERQQLNLRDWLRQQGVTFTAGSLRVRHTGTLYALAAQVTVTQMNQSWAFDFPVEAPEVFHRSSTLDGLWWLPEAGSQAQLILTNTAETPLTVRPTLWLQGHSVTGAPLRLEPHQMQELPLPELLARFSGPRVNATEGGLRLEHDGEPGDGLAYVRVWNPRGFSSTLRFVDPAHRQSPSLHGAGLFLKQSSVPGLGRVPTFDTWLLVGNTTAAEVDATVKVTYTAGGLTRTATLPVRRVGAYEVRRLEINRLYPK
jgi:hypothetical protein